MYLAQSLIISEKKWSSGFWGLSAFKCKNSLWVWQAEKTKRSYLVLLSDKYPWKWSYNDFASRVLSTLFFYVRNGYFKHYNVHAIRSFHNLVGLHFNESKQACVLIITAIFLTVKLCIVPLQSVRKCESDLYVQWHECLYTQWGYFLNGCQLNNYQGGRGVLQCFSLNDLRCSFKYRFGYGAPSGPAQTQM